MYDFKKIEEKWQQRWLDTKCFEADNNSKKQKYYLLVEFPSKTFGNQAVS